MAAGKKAKQAAAPNADEVKAPAASENAVAPVATKEGVPTFRTDLGESLPPQQYAGVE